MKTWQVLRQYSPFLFLALVAVAWFYVARLGQTMHKQAKYTIGYLTGSVYQPKSGKYYRFRFGVKNVLYRGADLPDKGMDRRIGGRIVVEYDSTNPARNVGYFAIAIPDSIRQAPANGWRKPPFPIPQWILERGKEKNKP